MVLGVGVLVIAVSARAAFNPPEREEAGRARAVERGRYLVSVLGCHDCHTPLKMGPNGPERDMTRMLSGHPETVKMGAPPAHLKDGWGWVASETSTAFAGPWGITFAMNLTPDTNTGIGIWTEDIFVRTIRTGKHWGTSRQIMPPMPWEVYRNLTDEDLKSVYAFLRTIPPITNHVPDYRPPVTTSAAH
jgi:mono/diheme cytochrome c family protein